MPLKRKYFVEERKQKVEKIFLPFVARSSAHSRQKQSQNDGSELIIARSDRLRAAQQCVFASRLLCMPDHACHMFCSERSIVFPGRTVKLKFFTNIGLSDR